MNISLTLNKIIERGKEGMLVGRIIDLKTKIDNIEKKEIELEELKDEIKSDKEILKNEFKENKDIATFVKTMTEEDKSNLLSGVTKESSLILNGDQSNVTNCNFL